MNLRDALGGITFAQAARNIADNCDRFIMALHEPFELDETTIVCTNHWGNPKPPWPCDDYADAALRVKDRAQTD